MRLNQILPVRGGSLTDKALAVGLGLIVVGCSDSNGQGPDDQPEVQRDLVENARDWEALGITSYGFTFTRTCFCPPELFRPARVVVRDNQIESVTYIDDGQPVDPGYLPSYQTIDELFEMIAEAVRQEAVVLDVEFDPDLHYPTDGYIDISEQIADEEQGFTATDLVPIDD